MIAKESEAAKGNFTQRCLLALGSLCANAPSSTFFTCSDIITRLIGNEDCDQETFFCLVNACNASLSQRYTRKHDGLFRTTKKITPKLSRFPTAKAALGYRLGIPVESPIINPDTLASARAACANPTTSADIHQFIQNASVPQLTDLILEITDAIVNKHHSIMNEAATARSKLKVLRDAVAEVDA